MQKFKVGDEVSHKSGGPKMVIKEYEPKDGEYVTCEWFNKNSYYEKSFHQDTLKPYTPPYLEVGFN
ncbi:YodC family protein [Marinoscillum sp.]|uniref:YodC family protein n=1 Tax=Marinoscillum sp. TaxID=2024838 RepID=UPI003BADBA3E